MDLLHRSQAPIAREAWQMIDKQAREVLTASMSARRIVGVSGPHGWEHAAVNLGRLDPGRLSNGEGVFFGVRKVQPLVEVRVPFTLDLWELDDVVRGSLDPELTPLVEAAGKLVAFEEHAIFHGFAPGHIAGMTRASLQPHQSLPADPNQWPEVIARATIALKVAGIPPPYSWIAGPTLVAALEDPAGQYPLRKQIESLIGGPIVLAPYVATAFLLPSDGTAAFELVLGQDVAIGFEERADRQVRLFFTESFTFRVIEPRAVVPFDGPASTPTVV